MKKTMAEIDTEETGSFGEQVLAREFYANNSGTENGLDLELEEAKETLKIEREEKTKMEKNLYMLRHELRRTEEQLHLLRERSYCERRGESEVEMKARKGKDVLENKKCVSFASTSGHGGTKEVPALQRSVSLKIFNWKKKPLGFLNGIFPKKK